MVSIGIPKPGGSHFPHIKIAILGLYNIFRHTNLNIFKDVLNRASCLEKNEKSQTVPLSCLHIWTRNLDAFVFVWKLVYTPQNDTLMGDKSVHRTGALIEGYLLGGTSQY
jgi:Sec7-like guanine-nucleotide exchange factor